MDPLRRTIGLVLIMIGGFWIMIAFGMLDDSFMKGQPLWAIVGAVIVAAGLAVLYLPRKKPVDDSSPEPSD